MKWITLEGLRKLIFKKRKQQPIFSTLSGLNKEDASKTINGRHFVENKPHIGSKVDGTSSTSKGADLFCEKQENPFDGLFAEQEFVYISPGKFLMGSDEEEFGRHDDEILHEVTLTKGFFMQTTLVMQKQWKTVMGTNPSSFRGGSLLRPVDGVSWNDCQRFINKLNSCGQYRYRLPTEAEWEYACRAGASTAFCNGAISVSEDGHDLKLDEVAWYGANSDGKTHPVAAKKPNAWGIYDMHGHLCEWCEDWYGKYPTDAQIDPVNTTMASCRVSRGGCWVSTAQNCRSASRFSWPPEYRSDFVGFRLVREEL